MRLRSLLVPAVLLLAATAAAGQQPKPCTDPAHRQFDFWIGDWTVTDSTGAKVLGRIVVTATQGGCVIHESWTGGGDGTGESFNIFDAKRRVWHQTWVSSGGALLLIEGGLEGDAMRLGNALPGQPAQRITYTPRPDGTLTQRWETSPDGETWQTVFLGVYTRSR